MKKYKSINKQLIIKYISIVTLATVFFLIMGLFIGRNILINNSQDLLKNFSLQVGKDVNDIIKLELDKVQIIAEMPVITNQDITLDEKLEALSFIVENHGYKKGAIIDTEGNCTTTLGEIVNVSDKEYFNINLSGKSHITAPNISKADGGLQISLTAPIMNKEKQVIGILFFSKEAEEFSEITNRISFGKTGTAYVVDKNGTNIINRDIQKVIDKVNRIEDAKTDSKYEELAQVTQEMIKGVNGTGDYLFNGERKYIGFAPIESTGWAVGITVESSDMLSGLNQMVLGFISIGIVIICVVFVVTCYASKKFSKRLSAVKAEVEGMSTGKFIKKEISQDINDEIYEIASSIENTKGSIAEIIDSIKKSSHSLDSECEDLNIVSERFLCGSKNINAAVEDSAKAAASQAEELSDINEILEKFDEKITVNSDNMIKVNEKSVEISNQANESRKDMSSLLNFIDVLNTSFNDFRSEIDEMEESMTKINDITKLINSISDQTNLLALNAAIEAARAGEAGKGFSVVADEIRNLAEQSKESTENTYKVIENVLKKVRNIIETSNVITSELIEGEKNVKNNVQSFEEIVESVSQITPMLDFAARSFNEILKEKDEIRGKVEEVSAVSEELSASSQEIVASTNELLNSTEKVAESTEKLEELAKIMNDNVDKFKIE